MSELFCMDWHNKGFKQILFEALIRGWYLMRWISYGNKTHANFRWWQTGSRVTRMNKALFMWNPINKHKQNVIFHICSESAVCWSDLECCVKELWLWTRERNRVQKGEAERRKKKRNREGGRTNMEGLEDEKIGCQINVSEAELSRSFQRI